MTELSFLPGANLDYRAAYAWYRERGEHLADSFEAAVDRALELITETPGRFAKYDDRHRCYLLRRFPYLIVYRVEDNQVLVVAVAHGRRQPGYWQDRGD